MDHIFLEEIKVDAKLGAFQKEKSTPQPVLVDVELEVDTRKAAFHDDLDHTVDYTKIARGIEYITQTMSFNLVEALADRGRASAKIILRSSLS